MLYSNFFAIDDLVEESSLTVENYVSLCSQILSVLSSLSISTGDLI